MESLIINCETGEEVIVKLSAQEIAEVKAREAALIAEQSKRESDAVAKEALLAKLGITAEEAALLLA